MARGGISNSASGIGNVSIQGENVNNGGSFSSSNFNLQPTEYGDTKIESVDFSSLTETKLSNVESIMPTTIDSNNSLSSYNITQSNTTIQSSNLQQNGMVNVQNQQQAYNLPNNTASFDINTQNQQQLSLDGINSQNIDKDNINNNGNSNNNADFVGNNNTNQNVKNNDLIGNTNSNNNVDFIGNNASDNNNIDFVGNNNTNPNANSIQPNMQGGVAGGVGSAQGETSGISVDSNSLGGVNNLDTWDNSSSNNSNDSNETVFNSNNNKEIFERYNAIPSGTLRTTYLQNDDLIGKNILEILDKIKYMTNEEVLKYVTFYENNQYSAREFIASIEPVITKRMAMESAMDYINNINNDNRVFQSLVASGLNGLINSNEDYVQSLKNINNNKGTKEDYQLFYKMNLLSSDNEFTTNIPKEYKSIINDINNSLSKLSNYNPLASNVNNITFNDINTSIEEGIEFYKYYLYNTKKDM